MVRARGNLVEVGLNKTVTSIADDILNAGKINVETPKEELKETNSHEETATTMVTDIITPEEKKTEQEVKEEENEEVALSNVFVVEKKETFDKKQKMYYMKLDNIAWVKKMAKKLNRSESDFIDTIIDSLKTSFANSNK